MTMQSAPVFQFQAAPAIIETIASDLRLLRESPNHIQAKELRANIEANRQRRPELLAMAELTVAREFEARDELRERPRDCPHCHGSGQWRRPGARWESFCSCPLGEAKQRGRTLDQDAFDRGITQYEPGEDAGQLVMFGGAA